MIELLELVVAGSVIGWFTAGDAGMLTLFVEHVGGLLSTYFRVREYDADVAADKVASTKVSQYAPRSIADSPITLYGLFRVDGNGHQLIGSDLSSVCASYVHAKALAKLSGLNNAIVLAMPFPYPLAARQWLACATGVAVDEIRVPTEYDVRVGENRNGMLVSDVTIIDAWGSWSVIDREDYAIWALDAQGDIEQFGLWEFNADAYRLACE